MIHDPVILLLGTLVAIGGFSLAIVEYRAHKEAQPVDWKDFGRIVEQLAPVVLSVIPGVPPAIIPAVVHGIQFAQAIPGATGIQKKAAALGVVGNAIYAVNAAADKQVIDPSAANAISNGIDTVIGVVNLVKGHSVEPDADLNPPPTQAPA